MSSDTDYPRQRTVAELLAEHGGGAPTGRRRRRREEAAALAAESNGVQSNGAQANGAQANGAQANGGGAPVVTELRPAEPAPPAPRERGANGSASGLAATVWGAPQPAEVEDRAASPEAPPPPSTPIPPQPDWPTEQIPPVGRSGRGVGHTGPMERLRRASPRWRDALEAVERSERELRLDPVGPLRGDGLPDDDPAHPETPSAELFRTGDRPDDGGPPTQAAAPVELGLEPDQDAVAASDRDYGALAIEPRPAVNGVLPGHLDHDIDDLDDRQLDDRQLDDRQLDDWQLDDRQLDRSVVTEPDDPLRTAVDPDAEATVVPPARRRLGRTAAETEGDRSVGTAWAWVIGQWLAGAVGGAALWVGFRFLWRGLPVVALAAAALITVGLVLLVRSLLRTDGPRTTVLAVLVGLVLTVSPAILVLLDR
jgi:hypothetical protein